MLMQRRFSLAVLAASAVLTSAYSARATQTALIATPFTGNDTSVRILLDDAGGDLTVTLTVNEGAADLRGFYINIRDFSLFDGVAVRGPDVTGFETGDVINMKFGNNLNGGGSPCPCDLGVALGTPGIGKDDISTTTFAIHSPDHNFTLNDFAGELIGVRVMSVGVDENGHKARRGGSAKLMALIPIPEPTTALLFALGLGALGYAGRSRR